MRDALFLSVIVSAVLLAALPAHADLTESEAAVVLDVPLVRTGVGAGEQTRGYTFDLDAPRTLTHLGMFLYNGTDGGDVPRQIGLWDADGALVAEVTVEAGGIGGEIENLGNGSKFIYVALDSPVILLPAIEYTVGVWYSVNNSPGLAFNVGFTTIEGFNYLSTVETGPPGGAFAQPTIVRADRLDSYIGPNLRFDFAIPSVSTLTLDVSYEAATEMLNIAWESQAGMIYDLLSSTDLAVDPEIWPVFDGLEELPATPPENVLSFLLPPEAERFFVIREMPAPPLILFTDDLESGQGSWEIGSDNAVGTVWELGAPDANVVGSPAAAKSGVNVFGTDLDANYIDDTDIWLRSPAVDLSGVGAVTLNYWRWIDIEAMFDSGLVRVLDSSDLSEIAVLEDEIEGSSTDWELESLDLPPEVIGKTVIFEWRLRSDNFGNQAGFYIDDVLVTGKE